MLISIPTERLILRPWEASDLESFYRINTNPEVMRFMPSILSREESDVFAQRIIEHFSSYGYGLFAVELKATSHFIGFIGLQQVRFSADFTPAVEIGWRLDNQYWNQGLATEGARRVLEYAFEALKLNKIVSFTAVSNQASRRVMEKIGLHRQISGDFEHPNLPQGHPLRRHVLYCLSQDEYTNDGLKSSEI